jgi:hypothetical protein
MSGFEGFESDSGSEGSASPREFAKSGGKRKCEMDGNEVNTEDARPLKDIEGGETMM